MGLQNALMRAAAAAMLIGCHALIGECKGSECLDTAFNSTDEDVLLATSIKSLWRGVTKGSVNPSDCTGKGGDSWNTGTYIGCCAGLQSSVPKRDGNGLWRHTCVSESLLQDKSTSIRQGAVQANSIRGKGSPADQLTQPLVVNIGLSSE
mmetsp:Transcript_8025/g.14234  ORF Transcript_8025/g.14234 Transcript_8025/m.14234 type:complete len:150 (+) Transcript_8025:59-508(+)